jgi:hypothetical protein
VLVGLAVTDDPEAVDNPVDGDHVYVLAPLAVNVVELPVVIATEAGFTDTVGFAFTVMVTALV